MMSGIFLTAVANRCRPYMDVSRRARFGGMKV
jgi:hypothetical protein